MKRAGKPPTVTHRILDRIRLLIYLSDTTQREVESRVGFSRGYLSQILGGTVEIKYWQLLAILQAIDFEPSEFFAKLFPRRRHPALEVLDDFRRQAGEPLSRDLAELFAYGIESIVDFRERLERCEDALEELAILGILERTSGKMTKKSV